MLPTFRRAAGLAALATPVLVPLAAVPATADETPDPVASARADWLGNFDFTIGRVGQLADAIPADKWAWRPAEGVRSVSEVVGHVAVGNYYLATFLGGSMPEGMSMESEKETDPAKLHEMLDASIAHVHQVVEGLTAAQLEEKVEFFGQQMTKRGILLVALGHVHEHLGQLIAYARMNGVVPPWTAAENAAAQETEGANDDGAKY